MITRFEERNEFYYFDFFLIQNSVIILHELFGIYTDWDVDQGWIQIISDIKSTFSIQLFDIFPIPEKPIESMRFIGSHIFADFRRIDDNLYHRSEDLLYFYETGFSLDGLRIKRLGNISESECSCRVKMIWRKLI